MEASLSHLGLLSYFVESDNLLRGGILLSTLPTPARESTYFPYLLTVRLSGDLVWISGAFFKSLVIEKLIQYLPSIRTVLGRIYYGPSLSDYLD